MDKSSVMSDISKQENIVQYELDALKEVKAKLSENKKEHNRRIDLLHGTALGLTLGILGHLFVQFLFPVVEAFLLGEYGTAFTGNLAICMISLVAVISMSMYLFRQLTKSEAKLELSKRSEEVLNYAIKRRQNNLEKQA
jgi:magnesium-transporting ATPase (P-type)